MTQANIKQNGWLRFARVIWIVLAAGFLVLWLLSLPGYYERASTLTVEPVRLGERVVFDNASVMRQAAQRGLSLEMNALYDIGFNLLGILVWNLVAIVILWRASNAFGWFTALILLLMSVNSISTAVSVARPVSAAFWLVQIPGYIVWSLWIYWLYLFPNGHPVPHRTRLPFELAVGVFLVFQVASLFAVAGILPPQVDTLGAALGPFIAMGIFAFVLLAQVYRYLKVSTFVERQQTKWFLFGISVFFTTIIVFAIVPDSIQTSAVIQDLLALVFFVFPISVGLAVLRYRLFDIDILIRRTLTYALVTALLVIVFFGSVVLLQQIFSSFTGSGQDEIVTVLSTLAIAALFVPARNRVQRIIDKRFNREKYNAQKVLQDFATTVRDETDLEKLTERLIEVVHETMQPRSVSVWLKAATESRRRRIDE